MNNASRALHLAPFLASQRLHNQMVLGLRGCHKHRSAAAVFKRNARTPQFDSRPPRVASRRLPKAVDDASQWGGHSPRRGVV